MTQHKREGRLVVLIWVSCIDLRMAICWLGCLRSSISVPAPQPRPCGGRRRWWRGPSFGTPWHEPWGSSTPPRSYSRQGGHRRRRHGTPPRRSSSVCSRYPCTVPSPPHSRISRCASCAMQHGGCGTWMHPSCRSLSCSDNNRTLHHTSLKTLGYLVLFMRISACRGFEAMEEHVRVINKGWPEHNVDWKHRNNALANIWKVELCKDLVAFIVISFMLHRIR